MSVSVRECVRCVRCVTKQHTVGNGMPYEVVCDGKQVVNWFRLIWCLHITTQIQSPAERQIIVGMGEWGNASMTYLIGNSTSVFNLSFKCL